MQGRDSQLNPTKGKQKEEEMMYTRCTAVCGEKRTGGERREGEGNGRLGCGLECE